MHTLSLFPSLLTYQIIGIFILRVTLGLTFLRLWYVGIRYNKVEQLESFHKMGLRPANFFTALVSLVKGVGGILLLFGFYTQGAALATGILMSIAVAIKLYKPELLPRHNLGFCLLLALLSFSLLFLGAGAFAIDLPL